jgi:hypothetical protein
MGRWKKKSLDINTGEGKRWKRTDRRPTGFPEISAIPFQE